MAIGADPDAAYDAGTAVLEPGDVLVLYTDGITEAENDAQEMFGEDRLRGAIVEARTLPAAAIVAAILDAVQAFSGYRSPVGRHHADGRQERLTWTRSTTLVIPADLSRDPEGHHRPGRGDAGLRVLRGPDPRPAARG